MTSRRNMAANGQSVPATAAADGSAAPSQPMSPASHATRKFLSGSASGVMSALILQPFDVVKTKQQGFSSDLRRGGRGLGAFQTVRGVIASDGVTGLWRGLVSAALAARRCRGSCDYVRCMLHQRDSFVLVCVTRFLAHAWTHP